MMPKNKSCFEKQGVREHLSVATFTHAISQPDFCSCVLEVEVALHLLMQALDSATSLNSLDILNAAFKSPSMV